MIEPLSRKVGIAGAITVLVGLGAAFTFALGLFFGALVAGAVASGGGAFYDAPVAGFVAGNQSSAMTQLMLQVTWFGNRGVVLGAAVLASVLLWGAFRLKKAAVFLPACVFGGYFVSQLTKIAVQRVRPEGGLAHASGGSFPSGHALASVTLYGGLAYIAWKRSSGAPVRLAVTAAALTLALLVGFSRIYLGVHWASDVVGGVVLGAVWLGICAACWAAWDRMAGRPVDGGP